MAIYEYKCSGGCGIVEIQHSMSAPPYTLCPKCEDAPCERLVSRNSFILKGGGWPGKSISKRYTEHSDF
jgi:putative FmdB family regulatory protein